MLAIFCHIANFKVWLEIKKYLDKIDFDYDLYLNISELVSKDDNIIIKNSIKTKYIFELENKGCDTGPLLYFINYLKNENIIYEDIIHLHTKTDDTWRTTMLEYIFRDLKTKLKNYDCVDGCYKTKYDYINYYYEIQLLEDMQINYTKDWTKFDEISGKKFENDFHRLEYLKSNPSYKRYCPVIFSDLYKRIVNKNLNNIQPNNVLLQIKILLNLIDNYNKLYYYAGTFMIFKHEIFIKAFDKWNFMEIYNSLETGKQDDLIKQTKTHALERIIPIGIQIFKNLY
jgi:hypothetical protein